jgi:hypothetical protein
VDRVAQTYTLKNTTNFITNVQHDHENGVLDAKLDGMSVDGMEPFEMIIWLRSTYGYRRECPSWGKLRNKVVAEFRKRGYDISSLQGLPLED